MNKRTFGLIQQLFILLFVTVIFSKNVTLEIIGNSGPGPYSLGSQFIDTKSIKLTFKDTLLEIIPDYIYLSEKNALLFSAPIDSGKVVSVNFETLFTGLNKNYSLYQKKYLSEENNLDTLLQISKNIKESWNSSDIEVTGYKSVGVTVGSDGSMDLTQALEIQIGGEINDKTTLSANLSDQGTSLDGDTREIGEIDLLYVKLNNPKFNVLAGDRYVEFLPKNGILYSEKKIKGMSAAFTGTNFGVQGYGAISGGKYAVENLKGQLGFQGPYYFHGNGEADIINPISGTVKITLNGKDLHEGEDRDYYVDYDVGSVRFTTANLIEDGASIRIEYEYKSFDYQRNFVGTDIYGKLFDSTLTFTGSVWRESDNKNHPIDITLDDTTIDSLKTAGDKLPKIPTGRPVHPNDVASQNALYRLYKDSLNIYVHKEYNPNIPEDIKGFYIVWFDKTNFGLGEYIIDTVFDASGIKGPVYEYVGAGKGNYTAYREVSAPQRSLLGEIKVDYNPVPYFKMSVDVAGESIDKNLFSDFADADNFATGSKTSFQLGLNKKRERGIWFAGEHLFSSTRLSKEVISIYDLQQNWDRSDVDNSQRQLWDITSGIRPFDLLAINGGYGQYFRYDTLQTQKGIYGFDIETRSPLSFVYRGYVMNHLANSDDRIVTRDTINAVATTKNLTLGLNVDDEWRQGAYNRGQIGTGINFIQSKVGIREFLHYSQARVGGNSIFTPFDESSIDTGHTIIWEQSLNRDVKLNWNVGLSSKYRKEFVTNSKGENNSVLLINGKNRVTSKSQRASSYTDYTLSFEKASKFINVENNGVVGDYRYDSTISDWVYDPVNGYKDISIVEVFDTTSKSKVRKSLLSGNWNYYPDKTKGKGLFRDLTWRGSFKIDEQIDNSKLSKFSSWIPGVTTLFINNDSAVTYANIYYQQNIRWAPSFSDIFSISINLRPYIEKNQTNRENGLKGGVRSDRRYRKFQLENSLNGHLLKKSYYSTEDTIDIFDLSISSLQRVYIKPQFSLFLNEQAGLSKKETYKVPDTLQGPYYRIKPGASLRLAKRGMAELSYTWSKVDIGENIEYPMAQGFSTGTTHTIDFFIDINAGDHLSINGNYRGEQGVISFSKKWRHTLSLEMKVFL